MDCYVSRQHALKLVRRLKCYHDDQKELQSWYGIDILSNLGRRNGIMSHAQEIFLSDILSETFDGVTVNGRPGAADIFVGQLDRELECKITSINQGKSIALMTDVNTLAKKGKLDHLYIVANVTFDAFAVIFVPEMTTDDFLPPQNGSKGKSAMIRSRVFPRATFLMGGYETATQRRSTDVLMLKERANILSDEVQLASSLADKYNLVLMENAAAKSKFADPITGEMITRRVAEKRFGARMRERDRKYVSFCKTLSDRDKKASLLGSSEAFFVSFEPLEVVCSDV